MNPILNETTKTNNDNIQPSITLEEKEKIYKNVKNSICKIITNDNNEEKYGFFCKITNRDKNNLIPVLITNYSTLSLEYIKKNKNIKLLLNEGQETKYLCLDDSRVYYTNKDINITIIGIKTEIDEINLFLEIDDNIYDESKIEDIYKNKYIYIIEKPHFKRDFISISLLQKINNNTIDYLIQTAFGCICTPIFNLENNKIIGIHMNEIESKENNNICFKKIIDIFNKRNEIIILMSLTSKACKKDVYYLNPEFSGINNTNAEIYVNGIKEEFKYYFKPNKIGLYIIKIMFKNILNNCNKMFLSCKNITKIDLSSFNTTNINNMSYMFQYCNNLTNANLSDLNAQNVLDLSYIFSNCSNLINIDLSTFKIKKVTNMQNMFLLCINLINVNLSHFDTENVTDMSYMFKECYKLKTIDLSSFNTQNVTKMNNLFDSCLELSNINLGNINTSNVTTMEKMLYDCQKLSKIDDLSSLNTEKVTNMAGIFYNCKTLKEIKLSSFNTENVINMNKMFSRCENLTNIDLSTFNTRNVTNMSEMFGHCINLTQLDLSNFNTDQVVDMSQMFYFCSNLLKIDLSTFNMRNIVNMNKMFYNCKSLIDVKLNFNGVENKLDLNNIFFNCYNLLYIDLSSLDSNIVKNISNIFISCINLIAIKINKKSYLDFKLSLNFNFI